MPGPVLVDTGWLSERLDDPGLRIFDVTVHLRPEPPGYRIESGHADYARRHIPGASFLDLPGDLSDESSDLDFTMPGLARIERVLSEAGLGDDHQVVLYSGSHVMWATRVWWMLRSSGFDAAAVLDGGLRKWRAEERRLCSEPCSYPPATFRGAPRQNLWATKDEVFATMRDGAVCTINALPREMHTGQSPMRYGRPGHIAGSENVPFADILDPDSGVFRSIDAIRDRFGRAGAFDRKRVITYCGGGISATTDAFALILAGHTDVAVYDGSLSEWARDEDLPMETGG